LKNGIFYQSGGVLLFFSCQRINLFVTDFFRLIGLVGTPYDKRPAGRNLPPAQQQNHIEQRRAGGASSCGTVCA
jgi:hypothetical protein